MQDFKNNKHRNEKCMAELSSNLVFPNKQAKTPKA